MRYLWIALTLVGCFVTVVIIRAVLQVNSGVHTRIQEDVASETLIVDGTERGDDLATDRIITLPNSSGTIYGSTLWVPNDGPARGTGQPCQVFIGHSPWDAEQNVLQPRVLDRFYSVDVQYAWIDAAGLPDGRYVGMVDVQQGRVQPCPN